ncbi:3-hydroxyacyl-CoA dehydrogenase family protein [Lunatimonas lonarensis]|nr:3-hydroxyacyl-CoA dehydrogenase family protein [Lunatimonas lonarensis]
MSYSSESGEITIGMVGLGLMGSSITACMLIAGHSVIGLEPVLENLPASEGRIRTYLEIAWEKGLVPKKAEEYMANLVLTDCYEKLRPASIVIESVKEDLEIKRAVFAKIDQAVERDAIISSNTSAIPISDLQEFVSNPARFFGLHWMQPAHTTRFLEIICGQKSDHSLADYLYKLAEKWDKEPVLVKKDIRGFIGNRLMYAMYREALHLVEGGYATIEDVDRACRNVAGYFIPMVGVFRWMDMTGIGAYHTVMKELFPTLSNAHGPNSLINNIVENGGNGIFNGRGFYSYTEEERALWEETYSRFTYEIRELALKYPHDVVSRKLGSPSPSDVDELDTPT